MDVFNGKFAVESVFPATRMCSRNHYDRQIGRTRNHRGVGDVAGGMALQNILVRMF